MNTVITQGLLSPFFITQGYAASDIYPACVTEWTSCTQLEVESTSDTAFEQESMPNCTILEQEIPAGC